MISFEVLNNPIIINKYLNEFHECFPRLNERINDLCEYSEKISQKACVFIMKENAKTIGFA